MNDSEKIPAGSVLAVLQRSEAFARVWPELAQAGALALRSAGSVEELAPLADACAVLVAVPSEEQDAP